MTLQKILWHFKKKTEPQKFSSWAKWHSKKFRKTSKFPTIPKTSFALLAYFKRVTNYFGIRNRFKTPQKWLTFILLINRKLCQPFFRYFLVITLKSTWQTNFLLSIDNPTPTIPSARRRHISELGGCKSSGR